MAVGLAIVCAAASTANATSPWLLASSLPYTPAYHSLLAESDRLIVIGGDIGSGPLNKLYFARAQAGGPLGAWRESPHELPQPVSEHVTAKVGRRIFVLGGTDGKTALRTVFSTEIDGGGPTGPWQSAAALLPTAMRGHSGVALGSNLFLFGGKDEGGKTKDKVYRNVVDASGQLGAWQSWGSLPRPLAYAAIASTAGQVYLIGGENEKGPAQEVYFGAIGPTGDFVWRGQRPLPRPSSRGAAFVDGAVLFYIGGHDGEKPSPATYAATINDDGSIGNWVGWLPLPKGMMAMGAASLNGKAYLAGGFDGSRFQSSIMYLPIDSPTAATPAPRSASEARFDPLSLAVAMAGLVAIVSLLTVVVALLVERRTPADASQRR